MTSLQGPRQRRPRNVDVNTTYLSKLMYIECSRYKPDCTKALSSKFVFIDGSKPSYVRKVLEVISRRALARS